MPGVRKILYFRSNGKCLQKKKKNLFCEIHFYIISYLLNIYKCKNKMLIENENNNIS